MSKDYVCVEEVKLAFEDHLKKYLYYDDVFAKVASSDFPDPYSNCYLSEDYIGEEEIDGEMYEQYESTADFSMFYDDAPQFKFYTFYKLSDLQDHTVAEYMEADKLYQLF